MALRERIFKPVRVANAKTANPAKAGGGEAAELAELAPLALAKAESQKTELAVEQRNEPNGTCGACGCGQWWQAPKGPWCCRRCAPMPERLDLGTVSITLPGFQTWRVANANPAKAANANANEAGELAGLAALALATPQGSNSKPSCNAEHRRQRVLAMLDQHPDTRYAVHVDDPDSDPVIVALAIRGVGTCELAIPRENYDAFEIMRLIDEHAQPESRSST